jgi:hypothetical protein
MTGEQRIYDKNGNPIGYIMNDNKVLYDLPSSSKSSTPYLDSLNNPKPSHADKIQKKKSLTDLLGGAFTK